jgi:hypothetical protein
MNAMREKIRESSRWLEDEGLVATRRGSYPHYPVGLTDRAFKSPTSKSYPVGRTGLLCGENRRDSWLSRGENRLNY